MIITSLIHAQTTVFTEDFENIPLNVTSSGSSSWARSNTLSCNGNYSDSVSIISIGDTTYLTTNIFSTSGNSFAILKFNQICKLSYADGGYLEVSGDSGLTWSRLTSNTYLGNGQFGTLGNTFNSISYSTDWKAINNSAIPQNTWWKPEIFDLSILLANKTNAQIRFVIADKNNNGAENNYGWLIDDIEVIVSNIELNPPNIAITFPFPKDSTYFSGPYEIFSTITDTSGIKSANLVYTVSGISDTVALTNTINDTYKGTIPSYPYGTVISYQLIATDSSANENTWKYPNPNCISFEIKHNPNNPAPLQYDAKLYSIESPTNLGASNTPTPVSIRIANKADTVLTKAQIGWKLDGNMQNNNEWNGYLTLDQVSDTIVLGNTSLNVGSHNITAWTFNPNDSLDQDLTNDTLSYSFYICDEILNGTYTLGGANADFQNFTELVGVLTNCGISGPVTINVNPGIYNEQLLFENQINGANAINTVLIKSVTNNRDDVTIIYDPETNGSIVNFDSVKFITLENLTFKTNLKTDITLIKFESFSSNININSCKLISPISNLSDVKGIRAYGEQIDSNTITNNLIIGGYLGIEFKGHTSNWLNNNVITNNTINDVNFSGISVFNHNSIIIDNNIIKRTTFNSTQLYSVGIRVLSILNYSIKNNNINIDFNNNGYGISVGQAGKDIVGGYADIINNSIIIGGNSSNSTVYGINIMNITDSRVFHNSILLKTGGNLAASINIGGLSTTLDLRNNIFCNTSSGYALKNAVSSLGSCDYNSYYTDGLLITKWGNTSSQTSVGLSAIKAASALDTNSIVADPKFYSNSNLHSYSSEINNAATPISGVTYDMDGDLRDTINPDIGADEFTIANVDIGVFDLLNVLPIDTQNRTLSLNILVRNFGIDTITSFDVKYKLDGAAAISQSWVGTLASGQSDTINLGSITLPVLNYNLTIYTELSTDTILANDSLINNFFALPLVELEPISLYSPTDGCDKGTNELISIEIANNGVNAVYNGITASYETNGGVLITETITDTIEARDTLVFTFNQTVDLSTGFDDSTFTFNITVNHSDDPLNNNNSIIRSIVSKGDLYPPSISDTTVNYGAMVNLIASSNSPVFWYTNDSITTSFNTGQSYTTPNLFDTTTYYIQASEDNPSHLTTIGFGTTTANAFDKTIYGKTSSYGKYQILYTPDELIASGLTEGFIESIEFHVGYNIGSFSLSAMNISMANVSDSVLTSTFLTNTLTDVYSAPFTGISNLDKWYMHTLSTPFYWDGTSSLLIQVCTQGNNYNAPKVFYTNTTTNKYLATDGYSVSCSTTTGSISPKRPNIKINTLGSYGCSSPKISVNINVPPPPIDVNLAEIVNPKSDCSLSSTSVTIAIVNNGTTTIPAGYTAKYKVDNNNYNTPETINTPINPGDTLYYTFNTLASLPSGPNGTLYSITAKLTVSGDNYAGNDSLIEDSINSMYTPSNPITTSLTINYANKASLSAIHTDSIFWYSDSIGCQYLGAGNAYITDYLYDSKAFYAQEQVSIAQTDYIVGTSTTQSGTTGPSPYGADNFGAKSQFLITAAELSALGMMQGPIQSISFNVATPENTPLSDFEIRIGNTNRNSMLGTYLDNDLTTVYNATNYTNVSGWNEHVLTNQFVWDGVSNIIVETSFKNNSPVPFTNVYVTNTTNISVAYITGGNNFNRNDSVITSNSSLRPNIKINQTGLGNCASELIPLQVNVVNQANYDAGIISVIEPISFASSVGNSTVKVILKNFGLSNITSAEIKLVENNMTMTDSVDWTGNLAHNGVDTIIISNFHFNGGVTNLKAWVELPNDTIQMNDTASTQIIVCMSGQYSINSIDGNYHSFTDAVNDLYVSGICGPVTFNVDSGLYNEQITLYSINGSSPTNTITFQSTNSDSSDVTINHSNTTSNNNYVIRFIGTENIIIKNIGIEALGNLFGNGIVIENGANNIKIQNNIIISSTSAAYGSTSNGISITGNSNNIEISNNVFKYGYKSIDIMGATNASISNIDINNNTLESFNGYGISLYYTSGIIINNNKLTSGNVGTTIYGIRTGVSEDLNIYYNKLILQSTSINYGIYYNANGTSTNHSKLYNNFISIVSGNSINTGLYITFSSYLDVFFNSVNLTSGSVTSYAFYLNGSSNINVKNNSFVSKDCFAMYITSVSGNNFDYNNIYVNQSASTNYVHWGSNILNLADLKSFDTNNNQNSVSSDPNYYSSTDLHAQQVDMYNAATPISYILTDIDNDIRNTTSPCIGADEFSIPAIDLGLTNTVYPYESSCGYVASDSIVVNIKNYGLNTLDFSTSNATIKFYIGNTITDSIIYIINSGILTSGSDSNIRISNNFNLSQYGNYIFIGNISINGDGNTANDIMPESSITNYPNITSFPFNEDFETGINLNFKEYKGLQTQINISPSNTTGSYFNINLTGGTSNGWLNSSTVTQAFNNTTHISSISSCDISTTNINDLYLQFKLRQTQSAAISSIYTTSWFRVMLTDANNTVHYLKNINGDSVFTATTNDQDPFENQNFDLSNYTGQDFNISFEASCKYSDLNTYLSADNVFIDDIYIWEPTQTDVAVDYVICSSIQGLPGEQITVKTIFSNMGSDTLYSVPLAYQVNTGSIVRDTAIGTFAPFTTDTFLFSSSYNLMLGNNNLCVFAELANDTESTNDTSCTIIKGMKTFMVSYEDDFDTKDDWFSDTKSIQWQLGTPSSSFINSTHSGQNAWTTVLNSNHQTGSTEYLYSPYFIIPTNADTAVLEFWMTMNVTPNTTYGQLEYSFDGTTWIAVGYIGDPNSNNWYNKPLNGKHYWNLENYSWDKSSIALDPIVFNTAYPFQLRFTFISEYNSVAIDGWAIDDFKIKLPPLAEDAGITNIYTPSYSTITGDSIEVMVEIKNFGYDTLTSIPISYQINGGQATTAIWTGLLLQDSTVAYTFTDKYYAQSQNYTLCAYTSLANDMAPTNDKTCKQITSTPGAKDAGVSNILAPIGSVTIGSDITVKIMIKNYGTDIITSVPIEYYINGFMMGSEVFNGNINPNDSAEYTFTTKYTSMSGNYTLCAKTNYNDDVDPQNDESCEVILGTAINITDKSEFIVGQNQPNPSSGNTKIEFYIPKSGNIGFEVVNMTGSILESRSKFYTQGKNEITLNSINYPSGIYYYSVSFEGQRKTFKMVIVR